MRVCAAGMVRIYLNIINKESVNIQSIKVFHTNKLVRPDSRHYNWGGCRRRIVSRRHDLPSPPAAARDFGCNRLRDSFCAGDKFVQTQLHYEGLGGKISAKLSRIPKGSMSHTVQHSSRDFFCTRLTYACIFLSKERNMERLLRVSRAVYIWDEMNNKLTNSILSCMWDG